jgi:hypothetical protein
MVQPTPTGDIIQNTYDEIEKKLKTKTTLVVEDIEIGAVEIKDGTADTRANVEAFLGKNTLDVQVLTDGTHPIYTTSPGGSSIIKLQDGAGITLAGVETYLTKNCLDTKVINDISNPIFTKISDGTTAVSVDPLTTGLNVNMVGGDIEIGAVEIKNAADDTRAKVKTDGTDNALVVVQNTVPTTAVTQSGGWSVGRTWTLGSGTDTVNAVQSGTWNIGTLSTITNAVTVTQSVAANLNTTVTGTVNAVQSGGWNIGTVSTITNAVTVTANDLDIRALVNTTDSVNAVQSGSWTTGRTWSLSSGGDSVTVAGTINANQSGIWSTGRTWTLNSGTDSISVIGTISGTVTANQGTAGVTDWLTKSKIWDGTNTAAVTAAGELKVNLASDIEIGAVEIKNGADDIRAVVKTDGTNNALVVVQNTVPTTAVTQSGLWSTGRTWTLASGTDSVAVSGSITVSNLVEVATVPAIYTVAMATANTEYSQALPANTKKFLIKIRSDSDYLKVKYGAAGNYITVPKGGSYNEDNLKTSSTLYFESPTATMTAEIVAWT